MQVQRLQRFATYGYLKQVVLKMIAADLADGIGNGLEPSQCEAEDMVSALRDAFALSCRAVLCCAVPCRAVLCCAALHCAVLCCVALCNAVL